MAAKNKSLAQSNKSRTGDKATNKRSQMIVFCYMVLVHTSIAPEASKTVDALERLRHLEMTS
jgi:hypothetical protein